MEKHLFVAALTVVLSTTAAVAASLPNGASTLTETYQGWSVSCQSIKDQTNCVMRCEIS